MARMTGGEAVLGALVGAGIDTLFVLPGVQNDAFFNALHDAGERLRWVVTRHEQGAGYMAYGYAAASGRPSAYCVVPGPGFLNTTAALATAYACSAPVFCLSGQIPSRHIGRGVGLLHELPDQLGIMRRLTKWAARVDAPQDAARLVAEAFAQMASGRPRPTALEMPMDVMAREAWVTTERALLPAAPPPEPDPEALARAAELLNGAQKPMIFVGGGAAGREPAGPGAGPAPGRARGRRLDGPGRHGRPLAAQHQPHGGASPVARGRCRARGGLALSARPDGLGPGRRLKVIRIDLDPTEIARHARPEVALLADASEALEALLPQIGAADRAGWRERVAAVKDEVWALYRRELAPQLGWIEAIRAALPEDGILVEDLTQIGYVSRIAFPVYGPRQYISSGYQGTLGMSLPVALGAKVACPGRPVVAIAGDGGFMYNVQELATAVQHGIAVVTVVFDDGAYGNVRRMQRQLYGNRIIASDLRNPDFVQLASSFGMAARQVRGPDDLAEALADALSRDEPALLTAKVGEMPDPWPYIHLPRVRA